jgi:antitoxin (DNA-binding transcriptional repressor) of toxin-antitoxin stability system
VLEDVGRTGKPILVTRFGKPVAEIVPPAVARKWVFGGMRDSGEIIGDIVGPIGAFEGLKKRRVRI